MRRCPHELIQHCPLYVAAHDAALIRFGCGISVDSDCPTQREHRRRLAEIERRDPAMVARCQAAEAKHSGVLAVH